MNPFFKQAENYVSTKYGKEFRVVKASIQDLPDFFGFTFNTHVILESEKLNNTVIGQGWHFLFKLDCRIFTTRTGLGFEGGLKKLRRRISQEKAVRNSIPNFDIQIRYDLRVSEVLKKQVLLQSLLKFGLTYTIPEIVGDSIFRIPTAYTENLLLEKLSITPFVFFGLNHDELPELIIELIQNTSCKFSLLKYESRTFAKYVSKASKIDLEPIW